MKNTVLNLALLAVGITAAAMLLWPFAAWSAAAGLVLRIIAAAAISAYLCLVSGRSYIRLLPSILTAFAAIWGIWLYNTSPHWANATVGALVADYISPFIASTLTCLLCTGIKRGKTHDLL